MLSNKIISGGNAKRKMPSEWNYFRSLANENESAFLVASGGIDTIAFTGAEAFVMKVYGGESGTQLLYTLTAEAGETADLWNCDKENYPLPTGLNFSELQGKPYSDDKLGEVELFTVVTSKKDGGPVSVAVAETQFSSLGLPYYRILACDLNIPSSPTVKGCVKNSLDLEFVYLKDKMTEIPAHAFYNTGLREYEIPDTITSIQTAAFSETVLEKIHIPETVTFLGEFLFSHCTVLKEVHLPENLTMISAGMFNDCTALKKINMPQGITKIGDTAFSGCRALNEIIFPETVQDFNPYLLFANCDVLNKFEFYATNIKAVDATNMFLNCHQLRFIDMPNVKLNAFGCPGKSASAKNKIGCAKYVNGMPINLNWEDFDTESNMTTVWNTSYTQLTEDHYMNMFFEFFSYGKFFDNKAFIITGSDGATDTVRDFITSMLGGVCVG